jgi:RNase adapter protein RapZ
MPTPLSFVVITGLSGAGKSFAIKCFEDMGFFCVDNLPTTLIPTFADLIMRSEQPIHRVALGVDVREGAYLSSLLDTIRELRARDHDVEVLFLEASEETLVRRYHESRRRHPLAGDGNALDGIRAERKALSDLREIADRIVDTSALTVHQLKDRLVELYVAPKSRPGLSPSLVSFGFKHGVPFDADLVFDVRFLPNPHFVDALRTFDGRDERVRTFVLNHPESKELLRRLEDFLRFVLPCYEREGKAYLTVAIGCTGGRHRSVTVAEELKRFLTGLGYAPTVVHRDLQRE